jgi:hypothetical protein
VISDKGSDELVFCSVDKELNVGNRISWSEGFSTAIITNAEHPMYRAATYDANGQNFDRKSRVMFIVSHDPYEGEQKKVSPCTKETTALADEFEHKPAVKALYSEQEKQEEVWQPTMNLMWKTTEIDFGGAGGNAIHAGASGGGHYAGAHRDHFAGTPGHHIHHSKPIRPILQQEWTCGDKKEWRDVK